MTNSRSDMIKNTIKRYLLEFDAMAKAINDIKMKCSEVKKSGEIIPDTIVSLRKKQDKLIEKIRLEERTQHEIINEEIIKEKKLEKCLNRLNHLKKDLLVLENKINKNKQKEMEIRGCKEQEDEVKETLLYDYRILHEKLSHARKNFPEIYKEVENETQIFFFTPFG